MKMMRSSVLLVGALLLIQNTADLRADNARRPKVIEIDFTKCFDASAVYDGYLFTFVGRGSGDLQGRLQARVLQFQQNFLGDQTFIEADYVVVNKALTFTARVGGLIDESRDDATLRGYVREVTAGAEWMLGASVTSEFDNYVNRSGTNCSEGTLSITPVRIKQRP